jgi:hypothetical protein
MIDSDSTVLQESWEWGRPFNEMGAPDFVRAVDAEIAARKQQS